jgi:hypothetical protein
MEAGVGPDPWFIAPPWQTQTVNLVPGGDRRAWTIRTFLGPDGTGTTASANGWNEPNVPISDPNS